MSEHQKQISAAFVKAQKGFSPALKTSTNPHFKSRYADLSACVEAVIDALNDNGIGLIQRTSEDETGVTVETVFIHESGEHLECGKLHVPASKMDPQGYGSALTYARRYSLMAACGIAPEDDDGNASSKRKEPEPKKLPDKALQGFLKSVLDCENTDGLHSIKDQAKRVCEEMQDEGAYRAILAAIKERAAELSKVE